MIEYLLLDLDDTILDFGRSEAYALAQTLTDVGIEPTEEVCERYSQINKALWKELELGRVTREQVMLGRFEKLFQELGAKADGRTSAVAYMEHLSSAHFFLPGALETVQSLYGRYRMFLVSNGTASVQEPRLKSADLNRYFEKVFISQNVGVNKPDKRFFDHCFREINGFSPDRAMIVGDSLTSDMLGGQNAGIRTCWINPKGAALRPDIRVDHQLKSIVQLPELLETL